MSILNLEHELIPVNLLAGEQRKLEFLELNPWGQVPVLVDAKGDKTIVLNNSQAILMYLAQGYGGESWLPTDAASRGFIMQWLSIATLDIQQGLAMARVHHLFGRTLDIETATTKSYAVLQVINHHLVNRAWLELDRPTIADLACFPYIALAEDGQISLADYPHVKDWIDRLKQLPGYIGMPGL